MISRKLRINNRNFIKYKFFNSLFLGTSIGSIFTIYTPLEPSVYSTQEWTIDSGWTTISIFSFGISNK